MRAHLSLLVGLLLPLLWSGGIRCGAGEATVTITNPLALDWPWELVHHDLPAGTTTGSRWQAQVGADQRPVQMESLADGRSRAWFIATLPGKSTTPVDVHIHTGSAASPLAVTTANGQIEIANGVYRVRLPAFTTALAAPTPLAMMAPPLTSCQIQGDHAWYGRSWFEGPGQVTAARTEILTAGPVFSTIRITYTMAPPNPSTGSAPLGKDGMDGVPWPPADHPGFFYEATLRFVVGDPWIDITERVNLPAPAQLGMEWKEGLAPDAAMWIRWFDYQTFGGNVDLHIVPLQPQPKQRGPFVMLRPCWHQAPGGGQDFVVTRGLDKNADPHAPAVGVIATFPSRWLNPFAQTIACYAEHGDTAHVAFPLNAGTRAWALLVGERHCCDTTEALNGLVRRHTEWTLDKQHNDYVLEWPRTPASAGPHILMAPADLQRLQHDFRSGADTAEMRVLHEFVAKPAELTGLDRDLIALITAGTVAHPNAPRPDLWLSRRYQDDFLNPTGYTRAIKRAFPAFDLFSGGAPIGGAAQAALGYIFSDPDQWPGYRNGWSPGNPNFHTDKYTISVLAAACLLDHPDAPKWLAFGKKNFDEDTARVLLPPDGVGLECPGYSTYSIQLQLELAKVFMNTGFGNPVAENPLFRKTGIWHRHLLTPVDARIGIRHQAPIGDTHRWGANDGEQFGALARFFGHADPAFASEMMGIWRLFRDQGMHGTVLSDLVNVDQSIPPAPLAGMDWGSHRFLGFGAIMRSRFSAQPAGSHETFATFRCGAAEGHAHNEQLSYHFYGAGTPVSLNYNCSYHPRGDHAALHNSMTFGREAPFTHAGDEKPVQAMEQLIAPGTLAAFVSTPVADLAVGEVGGDLLTLSPIEPDDAKFQYPYPVRTVPRIVHRRFQLLVKHPVGSALEDYLVIRDETISTEPQQTNIHLLAREVTQDGPVLRAIGQTDADTTIFLAAAQLPTVEIRRWFYYDDAMNGPGVYLSTKNAQSVADNKAWVARIHATDGQALIPPVDWTGQWTVGEYQKWVRLSSAPGTPLMWVLYARKRGAPEPHFSSASPSSVRVELGSDHDDITLATGTPGTVQAAQATVAQNGTVTVLLPPGSLPPVGDVHQVGVHELAQSLAATAH